jgi:diguanylate cyclase (GGDEF)-like protein
VTRDSQRGTQFLPDGGLHRLTPSNEDSPGSRHLSEEQRRALLELPLKIDRTSLPREFLRGLVTAISEVLQTTVAVVGRNGDIWVRAAVSGPSSPRLPLQLEGWPQVFDRLSATVGTQLELWRTGNEDWTLFGLASAPHTPVILILEGDWTHWAAVLQQMAQGLSIGDARALTHARPLESILQRLSHALADTVGIAEVGEVVLRHVIQAVPSRLASLASAAADGELSIVATLGYPRELVQHLRIASGNGVIGAVHLSRASLLVSDVALTPGLDRQRSRYRSNSFAAVPIVAGSETLGVLSLTDRIAPGPYTQDDVETLTVLMGPAALALARERVRQEALAYAQAAVIDPVSGLFNRRYFEARLDEELHRAVRQLTSVALLMVDLDEFKAVNDRFGHIAGDLVIRDISEILRRSVRIFDVCTRFGGEEFAVMMPGGTVESASTIAERIRHRVEGYQRSEPSLAVLRITASIGVAVSPPGVTARDLMERADRALYHAKRAGKNRVSTADTDLV